MWELLLLLLPVAAASGWYLGQRAQQAPNITSSNNFKKNYFTGLNFLINEQSDKAVDVFIKMMEVDSDTVEMHLILGNLFRRRGEVERAIRIHQNLTARPNLSYSQRSQALLALGQDYLSAGLLDRAERYFLEVTELEPQLTQSYLYLLDIYQQQKRWQQAIFTAQKTPDVEQPEAIKKIAQYYCELAEVALQNQLWEEANRYLKAALATDKGCARASILLGNQAKKANNFDKAIYYYQQVWQQDMQFFVEVVDSLVACYEQQDNLTDLITLLEKYVKEYSHEKIFWSLVKVKFQQDKFIDQDYLTNSLQQHPSLWGIVCMLDLQILSVPPELNTHLITLKNSIQHILSLSPIYRCVQCGFSGKLLHWQCPGCRSWSSIKPA